MRLTLFLLFCFSHLSNAIAEPAYPHNPLVEADGITLSAESIIRFDRTGKIKRWQKLQNLQTFAPVDGGDVILAGSSRGLFALDKKTGQTIWQAGVDQTVFSPSIDHGQVYAGSRSGKLYALRQNDGDLRWSYQTTGWIYSPAITADLVITGGQNNQLIALERDTGQLRWAVPLPSELVFAPVIDPAGNVLVTTFAGDVIALNASDGSLRWRLDTATPNASPVAISGELFVPGFDGVLRRLDPQTGRLLWSAPLGGRISPPRVFNQHQLLVSTDQGLVYQIDRQTGQKIQQMKLTGETVGSAYVIKNNSIQWIKKVGNKARYVASKLTPN